MDVTCSISHIICPLILFLFLLLLLRYFLLLHFLLPSLSSIFFISCPILSLPSLARISSRPLYFLSFSYYIPFLPFFFPSFSYSSTVITTTSILQLIYRPSSSPRPPSPYPFFFFFPFLYNISYYLVTSAFSRIPFQTHMLSNDTSRMAFNAFPYE